MNFEKAYQTVVNPESTETINEESEVLEEAKTTLNITLPLTVRVGDYHDLDALANILGQLTGKKVYATEMEMNSMGGGYAGVLHTEKKFQGKDMSGQKYPFINL